MDILGVIVAKSVASSSKLGCSLVTQLDGTTASCRGDQGGIIQGVPAGSDGDYEQGQITGSLIAFLPKSDVKNPVPYVYALVFADKLL